MVVVVAGTVRSTGQYADKTPVLEIHVPVAHAAGLTAERDGAVRVQLLLGDEWYKGRVRATPENDYVWVSPTVTTLSGERSSLGRVLSNLRVRANDRVQLKVRGSKIRVLDKWGYGLGTRAARLNAAIGDEPKTLSAICRDARYHLKNSASSHLTSLQKRGHILHTPAGYVAAQPDGGQPAEDGVIAERILRGVAQVLGTDLHGTFQSGVVRELIGLSQGSFTPILKGMRDEPGSAPSVRAEYRGLFHMISPGQYRLTDRGREVVGALSTPPPTASTLAEAAVRGGGAGFGTTENNALVERAACDAVEADYLARGWTVRSVERDRCGYDLHCLKGAAEEHAEVKGVGGTEESFIITAGEVRKAQDDPLFMLYVVLSARSPSRRLVRYTGAVFLARFALLPIQYRAVVKP